MAKETARLIQQLKAGTNEKDVENAYRTAFERRFPGTINSRWNTDGTLIHERVTVLLEFKYNYHLTQPLRQAAVILQAVFYLKQMERDPAKCLAKGMFGRDCPRCEAWGKKKRTYHIVDINCDCGSDTIVRTSVRWFMGPRCPCCKKVLGPMEYMIVCSVRATDPADALRQARR